MQVAMARADLDQRRLAQRLARDQHARRADALDLEGPGAPARELLAQLVLRVAVFLVTYRAESIARVVRLPRERAAARARLARRDAKERSEPGGLLADLALAAAAYRQGGDGCDDRDQRDHDEQLDQREAARR